MNHRNYPYDNLITVCMHVDSNCAVDMLLQNAIDVSLFAKDAEDILETDNTKRAISNSVVIPLTLIPVA